MKTALLAALIGSAAAFAPAPAARTSTAVSAGIDDLKSIAEKANPVIKVRACILSCCVRPSCLFSLLICIALSLSSPHQFYDPLELSTTTIWGDTNDATIGFLRQAEIKHGRVAVSSRRCMGS